MPNALSEIKNHLCNNPDIISANFYRWFSKENKKRKIWVHWLLKSRFFNQKLIAKKMHLLKTAYSFPLVKFYKSSLFYETNFQLKEDVSYQDIVLFNEMRKKATSWQFINKCLALYRTDRDNSSSNITWSFKRTITWIDILQYLDEIKCTCNAYMYCLVNGFEEALIAHKDEINCSFVLHKDFDVTYVWKILHPITKLILKWKIKKLAKNINLKLI